MSGAHPVRWGFLGAGYVASRALAPAVHATDGAVLQVVGARDPARAAALEPQRTTASYEAVCTADDVDVVYVALPNNDHLPWVLHALGAGKHVLCEKPLGLDAGEVAVMVEEATRAGRLLVEAAWNRWHPRTRRAEALLAGATGRRTVRASFTFSGVPAGNYRLDPARGGGALLDVGCYTVAASMAALGATGVDVSRVERHLGPTGVDLTTAAVLTHANGSATITASFERPEAQGLTIEAPGLSVEFAGQAFTT
ncbi:MAG: Gfo/Idh/MocA family oxidoreductase, partial [Kineosporiaceae bacterium]